MNQKSSEKVDIDLLAQAFADVLTRRTGIQHVCKIKSKSESKKSEVTVIRKKLTKNEGRNRICN